MKKDYSVAGTTREQRAKIVADGRGLAALSLINAEPDPFADQLLTDYIDGKIELADARKLFIAKYTEAPPCD